MAQAQIKELEALFELESHDLELWLIGKVPKHYKRLSVDKEEAMRLAKKGATIMGAAYGVKLFFTQAVIAGAILDEAYDEIIVASCSQYGKSWLMGHLALYRAYLGSKQYIAGAAANVTDIIMQNTLMATQEASHEIKSRLLAKVSELDRLTTSVSKRKLAFNNGGFVEGITLGDIYSDNLTANRAVGRGGDYIVDEAALVSEDTFAEMGRREFAKIDGTKYKSVLISNPHKPGVFYDKLTQERVPEGTIVIWMDALTAVEEERFTKKIVFNSDFARNKSTMRRYLLCVLDVDGGGMFDMPSVVDGDLEGDYVQRFIGVDAAYKGKDNIEVSVCAVGNGKIRLEHTIKIVKDEWIDGVTSQDIIKSVARIAYAENASMICVDVGWGVWLVEGLAQLGLNVRSVNFAEAPTKERQRANHYAAKEATNKRAEMHLDMQDFIESQTLEVTGQVYDGIKDTLPYVTATRKASGKIEIVKKSAIKATIGRSPDELDSCLLALHAAVRFLGDSVYAIP